MRILFVSNYEPWLGVSKATMPSHHLFGIHQMIENYSYDGTSATIKREYGGGIIDFFLISSSKDIVRAYFKGLRYDVVYDSMNVVSKYFSILNKYHLMHPKLISIYHHPPFTKLMRYGRSNVSVFFTERLLSEAQKDVNDKRVLLSNHWYPDRQWYVKNSIGQDSKSRDFMDNGKTGRDHETFVTALKLVKASGVMICSETQREQYKNTGADIEFFCQKHPNDLNVLPFVNKSKVMVVPLFSTRKVMGPIGNTSYMDAIATGMPVICSDNASFADEVTNNGLGVTYTSKSVESLAQAMREILSNYGRYHLNMIKFSNSHTIEDYAKRILPYIIG